MTNAYKHFGPEFCICTNVACIFHVYILYGVIFRFDQEC